MLHQPDSVITAQLGESATLRCNFTHQIQYMFWYKQKIGEMPRVMVLAHALSGTEFKNEFSEEHYSIHREHGIFHMTIKNVTASDEGFYFCATRDLFSTIFGNGTFLAVRGKQICTYSFAQFYPLFSPR